MGVPDALLPAWSSLLASVTQAPWLALAMKFFPFVLLLEAPLYLLVTTGMVRYGLRARGPQRHESRLPRVSCIVTCYAEGADACKTIASLAQQLYPGVIEIIAVVDGAQQNTATLQAVRQSRRLLAGLSRRTLRIVPKWPRGGRVSSLNAGLSIATGEIVMALDADTSFDNDMVRHALRHFGDPRVVGVAGNLRVRNAGQSLVTRLQALEYVLSIGAGKTGLSEFHLVSNISGAFGAFRADFLRHTGGWDAGSSEDLDITLRIKQYFGRHPDLRIVFDPHAIGHTDAPTHWRGFWRQRLRWEGDLFYLLVRKYRFNLQPRLLGWRDFLFVAINGLVMQVLQPFLIIGYSAALLWTQPAAVALGVLALVYLLYLAALAFYFLVYLVAVSERPRTDAASALLLPLFPAFAFAARVHCAFATVAEMFLRSHLDSSMAPWWVLRKTKF